jgi:hypothetical protein
MKTTTQLYKQALGLSIFTIVYNTVEGLLSVLLGAHDETLTLFGFGLDSIVESLLRLYLLTAKAARYG